MTDVHFQADSQAAPHVIIIILNYNSYDDAVGCVHSVEALQYPNFSIVIVDNASPDGSGKLLQETFRQHTVILSQHNGGFAAGNNIGIRYALEQNADYVMILNDDSTVEPDLLTHMTRYAEANPRIGLVSARVYYPGTTQVFSAAGKFSRLLCTGQNKGGLWIRKKDLEKSKKVDYACGVLMLIRHSVFRKVGLMDERFFMYFEDMEFTLRVGKEFEMGYAPEAIAYHTTGSGKGWKNYTPLYLYYHTRNRFWAFEDSSRIYKVYVSIFATVNCLAKTALIVTNFGDPSRNARKQLKSLWTGWWDGICTYLNGSHATQR